MEERNLKLKKPQIHRNLTKSMILNKRRPQTSFCKFQSSLKIWSMKIWQKVKTSKSPRWIWMKKRAVECVLTPQMRRTIPSFLHVNAQEAWNIFTSSVLKLGWTWKWRLSVLDKLKLTNGDTSNAIFVKLIYQVI